MDLKKLFLEFMIERKELFKLLLAAFLWLTVLPLFADNCRFLPSETTIWFDAPATNLTESTPLGNGRLGAMIYGGVDQERIVLNDSTMWSGSRWNANRPDAYKYLPQIRHLLIEGKNVQAEALDNAHFTCKSPGSGSPRYGCYQVLGNLHLTFLSGTNAPVENYRRVLNLNDAVAHLEYRRGDVTFTQEMFVSAPDQVIVLRLNASRPGQISFDMHLDRPERFKTVADKTNELLMTGQLANGVNGKGVRYAARVRVLNQGGDVSANGDGLRVSKANTVTVLITAATDYQGFAGRHTRHPEAASLRDMNQAEARSYRDLLQRHIADYQKYFQRASLYLKPADSARTGKPTPERLRLAAARGGDPSLAALDFNFGRYLLISSSRPGGFPANLQGIWANEIHTPWNGDWHLDVNVEMNYWPAEVCNLSALAQPLFALTASLQKPGAVTAHDYYDAGGWVAHVITNPWGFTAPGESASWGAAPCGSPWLCELLYKNYLFTQNRNFLKWAYPIMKGAAKFFAETLIEEPTHHWLVVAPANSPENQFELPDGKQASLCMGPTMLEQQVRYLFSACIQSSRILGADKNFRKELIAKRARLAPTRIGPDGCIMEWLKPYKQPHPHHRHISHLWGLYPGDEISPYTTPKLAEAARKTLEARGDGGVGWSLAYKSMLWAKLGDGNHAWLLMRKALTPAYGMTIRYNGGGGIYPNLFNVDPPFQIDGNFGLTATVAEMLLQSQNGVVRLLPALPDAWPAGKVTGLCAQGDFVVGLVWQDGHLISATIRSNAGAPCRVSYDGKMVKLKIKKRETVTLDGNLSVTRAIRAKSP